MAYSNLSTLFIVQVNKINRKKQDEFVGIYLFLNVSAKQVLKGSR